MNKYELLDKELAEALGYHDLTGGHFMTNQFVGYAKGDWRNEVLLPRWTQDDAACFRLIDEHCVNLVFRNKEVTAKSVVYEGDTTVVTYSELHDSVTAMRFAIVQAVINKLKGNTLEELGL